MTITKEGALASFYTMNKAPIKHLRVYFSPKQAGEGDPSPENVREISGWDGITVYKTGKNLLDPAELITSVKNYYTLNDDLIYVRAAYGLGWGGQLPTGYLKAGQYYATVEKVSGDNSESGGEIRTRYEGMVWSQWGPPTRPTKTLLQDTDYSMRLSGQGNTYRCQIELGSSSTGYEPYRGQTHTIDWTDEVGTIYGGYVDLITGELVETWGHVDLSTINTWYLQTYENAKWFRATLPNEVWNNTWSPNVTSSLNNHPPHFLIDRFKIVSGSSIYYGTSGDNVLGMDWLATIRIKCDSYNDDIDAFKAAMNGVILYYEYATPITHQLTPTQLQTLIGQNNIWSNADRVEIEYDLAESNDELYRRRNIILNTPHIETAIGSIASFKTDLAAPLKECKVYFSPVQDTSNGAPSPDNICPISGWTGCEVWLAGKNLLSKNLVRQDWFIAAGSKATAPSKPSKFYRGTIVIPTIQNVSYEWKRTLYEVGFLDKNMEIIKDYSGWNSGPVVAPTNAYYIYATRLINDVDPAIGDEIFDDEYLGYGTSIPTASDVQPYTGTTLPIDWADEAGTVYGGYVDLTAGELVQTYIHYNLGDLEATTYGASSYDGAAGTNVLYYIQNTGTGIGYPTSNLAGYSDKLKNAGKNVSGYWIGTWSDPDAHIWEYCFNASNQLHVVYDNETVGVTSDMSFAQRRQTITAWLQDNPITIVAPLATPIYYSLTPTQFKTLRGTNNVWSNANGNIEISYWKH